MIVSSTGTSTTCLGAFLGAFLAAIFDGCCFLAMGFAAPLTARWTLDFAFFGVLPFAAFLRAGSALGLPRFELFLRVATRFFALAMIVPCEYAASTLISNQANYAQSGHNKVSSLALGAFTWRRQQAEQPESGSIVGGARWSLWPG
jgi:hypothetical protein